MPLPTYLPPLLIGAFILPLPTFLQNVIKAKYGQDATNVGDEGGFAPNIHGNVEGVDLLRSAIETSGSGRITIGMDVAASEFLNKVISPLPPLWCKNASLRRFDFNLRCPLLAKDGTTTSTSRMLTPPAQSPFCPATVLRKCVQISARTTPFNQSRILPTKTITPTTTS